MVGPKVDLRYSYDHLGDDPSTLKALTSGTHSFSQKLKSAKKPLIIIGADTLERSDGAAILAQVQNLANSLNPAEKDWKVLNVLHKVASQVRPFKNYFYCC